MFSFLIVVLILRQLKKLFIFWWRKSETHFHHNFICFLYHVTWKVPELCLNIAKGSESVSWNVLETFRKGRNYSKKQAWASSNYSEWVYIYSLILHKWNDSATRNNIQTSGGWNFCRAFFKPSSFALFWLLGLWTLFLNLEK